MTYLSMVADVVTISGLVALGIQLKQSREQFRQVVRARLSITGEKIELRGRATAALIITNYGQSSATKISITFDPNQKFHALRGHQNLMFLAPNNIERIDAGESLTFTLGPLGGNENMSHLLNSSISGSISYYANDDSQPVKEKFQLTLSQKGFLISRTSIHR